MQRNTIKIGLGIVVILSFAWVVSDPSFEPVIGLVASIGVLISNFWPKKKPSYVKNRLRGRVSFDYSNNNGRFIIGENELKFETAWSKASGDSIHVYNDPPSIESLGLAIGITSISQISDASVYTMNSRTRTPQEGEIVIFKNNYGNYAAVQVIDIKDRTRNDDCDELTFKYMINPDGGLSFSDSKKHHGIFRALMNIFHR